MEEAHTADPSKPSGVPHLNQNINKGDNMEASGHNIEQNAENSNKASENRVPPNTKTGKQSFASLFKDKRAPSEMSLLRYVAPPLGEVVLNCEEIDSVEKSFGFCLVGYVMGPRPRPFTVLNFVKRWGENVKFAFKDNGWIKFQFLNETDMDSVLNGGPYMISGRQLFLKKMPSCFLFSKEDMMFLPSWIKIYGLPADCWTAPALSKIASVVGKPVHTDQLTISKKGSTYARVLVEIDAKKPRVWDYPIKLPTGKTIVVKFNYELDPKFCSSCNSFGHVTEMCGVDTRKKSHDQQMKKPSTKDNNVPADGMKHEATNSENTTAKSMAAPECSTSSINRNPTMNIPVQQASTTLAEKQIQVNPTPVTTVYEKQPKDTKAEEKKRGKSILHNLPISEEQQQKVFEDDDLLSCDDGDCYVPKDAEFDLDSDDLEDLLSRVRTQDQEEWKMVTKKNRRIKNKEKVENYKTKADSGASSMETEFVAIDPTSKQPMQGVQPRIFKKNLVEVRRPKTAFGGQ